MGINLQVFLFLSLMMAVIISLLFIANTIFAKKISAKVRYIMWIVIMIGLIIPLRPSIGNGVIDIPNFTTIPTESTEHLIPEAGSATQTPATPSEVFDQRVARNHSIPVQTMMLMGWATVAIGIALYHLFQYVRFGRAIKRWGEPEEDEISLELFERVKQEMKLENCKIQLVVCGFISTSMLTGFFKPTILLPERNYDDMELELIFRHELIHYRRKDLWIKLFSVVAVAIHWFNPLVYLMNIALQTEGEASCDQEVLEMSKLKNRHFYAEVIIGMIGEKRLGMTTFSTNFYGGKKGIKRRLEEIMVGTTPHQPISYVFLALTVILTVMSGSVFAVSSLTDMDQNTTEESRENHHDFFEIAINTVGGGSVTEYEQLSDERLLIHVAYNDEVYLVEVDMINTRVIGLSIAHENPELVTGDHAYEINEPVETDIDEIPTEVNTDSSQEESHLSEISSARAGEIALGVAPGRLVEVSRDWENGRPAWWVEIRHGGMVHEFYIDMETGAILQHEIERDD
ncbi:MAG: PepSY domain-containing protein [Defluviitaleaceae bacterium]|nr:PepSY domain-containing protein [Defluviitaleaceae bacterium]